MSDYGTIDINPDIDYYPEAGRCVNIYVVERAIYDSFKLQSSYYLNIKLTMTANSFHEAIGNFRIIIQNSLNV